MTHTATLTISANTRRDVDAVACAILEVAGRQKVSHPRTEAELADWCIRASEAGMRAGVPVAITDTRIR